MSEERLNGNPLEITSVSGFEEVETLVRQAPTAGIKGGIHHPYRNAEIELKNVPISDLHPCALYVLDGGLKKVRQLRTSFLEQGVDIHHLSESKTMVRYNWIGRSGAVISPPIVETSADDKGQLVIVDGEHRVFDAIISGEENITVTLIKGSATPIPSYPVGWDEVKIVDKVPPSEQKRKFRFDGKNLPFWVAENYQRFMGGFDFPETTILHSFDSCQLSPFSGRFTPPDSDSAFVFINNGIIMVRRREDDLYALPAGHADPIDFDNQSPWAPENAATVRRELYEETGLIALRWKEISRNQVASGKQVHFWQVEVNDREYVPMDVAGYINHFNRQGGTEEISEIGIFSAADLTHLKLFRENYNVVAIAANLLYSGLPLGEINDEDLADLGLIRSEWHSQTGVEPLPLRERYRRDFSNLRDN